MHYHCEVVIPAEGDVEQAVTGALAPHRENDECTNGFWDWWQIGGRWSGAKDGYEADKDPANIEVCSYCRGYGKRGDKPCNGCSGEGKRAKWPTEWKRHAGDIVSVSAIPPDFKCYTLVLPDGTALVREKWTGEKIVDTDFDGNVAKALAEHGVTSGRLVTVDYHS